MKEVTSKPIYYYLAVPHRNNLVMRIDCRPVHYSQLRPHLYNGGLTLIESELLFWENAKAVDSR